MQSIPVPTWSCCFSKPPTCDIENQNEENTYNHIANEK